MHRVNQKRLFLGTVVGGLAWAVWSWLVHAVLLSQAYQQSYSQGHLLTEPRYPFFLPLWFVLLFLLTAGLAWLYAGVRQTLGPGPGTALKVGFWGGFLAGFPLAFSMASWVPVSRTITLGWMADLWLGAMGATFLAAWLYRD